MRLASGERTIGSIEVANEPDGRGFTEDDRRLLDLFATQAAVAIDYTRVREDLQRLALLEDRERIGRELHDGAIQALFAIGMGLQGMAAMTADPVLRERLDASVGQIDEVLGEGLLAGEIRRCSRGGPIHAASRPWDSVTRRMIKGNGSGAAAVGDASGREACLTCSHQQLQANGLCRLTDPGGMTDGVHLHGRALPRAGTAR